MITTTLTGNTFPRQLDVVQKVAIQEFMNGEKLSEDGLIIYANAFSIVHVNNPESDNKEYDVAVFVTDCGIYYSGSETVMETARRLIETVLAEKPEAKVFTFKVGSRESTKNKGRRYLTLQLIGVE